MITDHAAVDTELGVLKTGKEADVHLLERAVPDTGRSVLLAAKRYRSAEHRMFHRDAGYVEGRRVRRSRETRAMARRTEFGRDLLAGQWAAAEFAALARLWADGVAVPYPVQLDGTELLLEFVGSPDGRRRAPRLAQLRPDREQLADLWRQLAAALRGLARHGLTHGDLSAFNVLVTTGEPARPDRPAAGRRRGRQPAGAGVPRPGRGPGRRLVRRTRAAAPRRTQRPRCSRSLCADLHIPRAGRSGTTSHVREGHTDRR